MANVLDDEYETLDFADEGEDMTDYFVEHVMGYDEQDLDLIDQQPPRYPADQSTVGTMTDPTTPPPR